MNLRQGDTKGGGNCSSGNGTDNERLSSIGTRQQDMNLLSIGDSNLQSFNGNDQQELNVTVANLEKSNVNETDQTTANANETDQQELNVTDSNLEKSNVNESDQTTANAKETDQQEVNVTDVNLEKSNANETDQTTSNAKVTDQQEVNVTDANLEKSNVNESDQTTANAKETDQQELNVTDANLETSNVNETDQTTANANETYQQEVNVTDGNLETSNVNETDQTTANANETDQQEVNVTDDQNLDGTTHCNGATGPDITHEQINFENDLVCQSTEKNEIRRQHRRRDSSLTKSFPDKVKDHRVINLNDILRNIGGGERRTSTPLHTHNASESKKAVDGIGDPMRRDPPEIKPSSAQTENVDTTNIGSRWKNSRFRIRTNESSPKSYRDVNTDSSSSDSGVHNGHFMSNVTNPESETSTRREIKSSERSRADEQKDWRSRSETPRVIRDFGEGSSASYLRKSVRNSSQESRSRGMSRVDKEMNWRVNSHTKTRRESPYRSRDGSREPTSSHSMDFGNVRPKYRFFNTDDSGEGTSWRDRKYRKTKSEFPSMQDNGENRLRVQDKEASILISSFSGVVGSILDKTPLHIYDTDKQSRGNDESDQKNEVDVHFDYEAVTDHNSEMCASKASSSEKLVAKEKYQTCSHTVLDNIKLSVLQSWQGNEDNEDVLLQIFNSIESVERLLMMDAIEEEWYTCLVQVLTATVTCHTHTAKLQRVLQVLNSSHFLTHFLSNYLDLKQEQETTWTHAEEFYNYIISIVQSIAKFVPERVQNCKPALKHLQRMISCIEPLSGNQEIKNSIASVLSLVTEIQQQQSEKQPKHLYTGPNMDLETPPEDFRELSVIPTSTDLSAETRPFVRAAITKGEYKNQDHYLDIQFRLMREDFIKPLRRGIQEYRDHGHSKHFKSSDVHIYRNVHFVGITCVKGVNHVIQFDVSHMKKVKWGHSKLLLNGNLICLSNDDFQSNLIFATVSFRDPEFLKLGIIWVECISGLDIILKTTSSNAFVMAETTAYYEATRPILEGLQSIQFKLPLSSYIISCQTQLRPPMYLLQAVRKYNISCLMETSGDTEVSVLNPLSWPSSEMMCLNPSQREAAIQALTKEISVIQGPPGTGKTYVGLKVMQVLLENQNKMVTNTKNKHDPILVICYTNHALDQFLEGILTFCPEGIVRVGGNKSSEALKPFNLVNLTRQKRSTESKTTAWELHQLINECAEEIDQFKTKLDSLATEIAGIHLLLPYIQSDHLKSLRKWQQTTNRKFHIHQWLNLRNDSSSQNLTETIRHNMTKLVMECLALLAYDKGHGLQLSQRQSIVERIQIYRRWLSHYQACLKHGLTSSGLGMQEKNKLSALFDRSLRPSILSDSEISNVIPPEFVELIRDGFGFHGERDLPIDVRVVRESQSNMYENNDQLIEAWVLGLHNHCSKQLDEFEELKKFIRKSQKTVKNDDEDFDDEEASINAMKERQLFEDENSQQKFKTATLQVMKEGPFLLQRVISLGMHEIVDETSKQDGDVDGDGFQTVTHKKPYSQSKLQQYLSNSNIRPMKEEDEAVILDLWELNMRDRFALYKLWINRYKESVVEKTKTSIKTYNAAKHALLKLQMNEETSVLRNANVIGMTTTGAAKKRPWLEAVGCRIIVVEEAAEVLEAHIVTALNKNCQHLILIGDHKQLRPNPTVYEHAKHFGLDVSLFERLVMNNVPHVTLSEQHRMRESISVIMRHIYPSLQDHVSVKGYANVRGVSRNVFFIQHHHEETTIKDSLSKSNPFEAKYVVGLCNYFLLQGYRPSQITMLATYGGQVLALKKEIKQRNITNEVRVSTVDNFQGEENDIILLSLVRSNEENIAGFLKVDNRVCVALSRAKKGLFAIGNLDLLASQSRLWHKIKQSAEDAGITGDGLPISCPNHPDEKNVIRVESDFDCSPQGGCLKKCDFRLNCGHVCPLLCHGYDPQHTEVTCFATCNKSCPSGHPCRKKCYQDCGDCMVKVQKLIPECGHTNAFNCSKIPDETDCYSRCEAILSCDHCCSGKCGECKKPEGHKKCQVPVSYIWPCDHAVEVPCHFTPDENPCPKPCEDDLQCGHKCPGSCSECLSGAVHVACTAKCGKVLPCGHACQTVCGLKCPPCQEPCPVACRHFGGTKKAPKHSCGESCSPCKEPCLNRCQHRNCTRLCHEKCNITPCEQPCYKLVARCHHPCAGLCGELCVCRQCQRISKCKQSEDAGDGSSHALKCKTKILLKVPSCWHTFVLEDLDDYVFDMDEKTDTELIRCPQCSIPIQKCQRYDRIFKKRHDKREAEKKNTRITWKKDETTTVDVFRLRESLDIVQENDTSSIWVDRHKTDYYDYFDRSSDEIRAFNWKIKFAYVMNIILAMKQDENTVTQVQVKDSTAAILKIKKHISRQQIQEYKLELRRLLLLQYCRELKTMAQNHAVILCVNLIGKCRTIEKELNCIKPATEAMERGADTIDILESTIEVQEDCADGLVQELLRAKKGKVKHALAVLDSDNEQMLFDIMEDFG